MDDPANFQHCEGMEISSDEQLKCETQGCPSLPSPSTNIGRCFASDLGQKVTRGWYKHKKVWERTYNELRSEKDLEVAHTLN